MHKEVHVSNAEERTINSESYTYEVSFRNKGETTFSGEGRLREFVMSRSTLNLNLDLKYLE